MRLHGIVLPLLLLLPAAALATQPIVGTYLSTDMGGPVDTGRFTEAWVGPQYNDGVIGNTLHAMSYAGSVLGAQWELSCPSIMADPILVSDDRVGGTGEVVYRTFYEGGWLWLDANGPWGDGSEDYIADVDLFRVTSTHLYVGGVRVGVRSNITMTGIFRGFDNCLDYSINNAAIFGTTDMGAVPADYPAFLDPDLCQTGILDQGSWGSVTEIALVIHGDCTVGSQESSWGSVKALFR